MSDDNSSNDPNVRRSKRIAAKEDKPQLMDSIMADLEREESTSTTLASAKKTVSNLGKKKFYRSTLKTKPEGTGTLFDQGLKAMSIIGATSVEDENKGTNDICYLVKYDNGQFELVLNTVAHKFCPSLVIDFLESRILFRDKDKDDFDLSQELFGETSQLGHLSDIAESTLSQIEHSSRSIEI